MSQSIAGKKDFKPLFTRAESKAETTDRAARLIIKDEATKIQKKTAKLRQQRLENQLKISSDDNSA